MSQCTCPFARAFESCNVTPATGVFGQRLLTPDKRVSPKKQIMAKDFASISCNLPPARRSRPWRAASANSGYQKRWSDPGLARRRRWDLYSVALQDRAPLNNRIVRTMLAFTIQEASRLGSQCIWVRTNGNPY